MLTALRRRPAALGRQNDAGVTLVELLVAMSLMSVIGAMSLTYFVGSHTNTDRTTDESLKMARARAAMTTVMRELQLADSPGSAGAATGRFDSVTATQVVFYANDTANRVGTAPRTAPTKISVTLNSTAKTLTLVRYAPVTSNTGAVTWPTASASQVLATDVTNAAPFSCTADGVACLPATATTPVTSVTVTLTIAGYAGKPAQTLVSTAAMSGIV